MTSPKVNSLIINYVQFSLIFKLELVHFLRQILLCKFNIGRDYTDMRVGVTYCLVQYL
jgi:hypothetical protein